MNKRPFVRCASCGSLERTRIIKLVLDREFPDLRGASVLHLAPEKCLSDYLTKIPGIRYLPVDVAPEKYKHCRVMKLDLVDDAERLPTEVFDIIIHSHVMEHIPSNVTAVLAHLQRSLSLRGRHIFALPIHGGAYEEDLSNLSKDERIRRFYQDDHVRKFGKVDIQLTLGKVFDLPQDYNLLQKYPGVNFSELNISEQAIRGWSGASVICLKKTDYKLSKCPAIGRELKLPWML